MNNVKTVDQANNAPIFKLSWIAPILASFQSSDSIVDQYLMIIHKYYQSTYLQSVNIVILLYLITNCIWFFQA